MTGLPPGRGSGRRPRQRRWKTAWVFGPPVVSHPRAVQDRGPGYRPTMSAAA